MDESEDFATLFARSEAGPTLERGQAVKGRVIQITSDHVFVDVGGKGEAWIDRAELTDDDGRLRVAVGDEVEATVVGTGDEIRLSHKLRRGAQAREALEMAAQSGITVEGRVAAVIKGATRSPSAACARSVRSRRWICAAWNPSRSTWAACWSSVSPSTAKTAGTLWFPGG